LINLDKIYRKELRLVNQVKIRVSRHWKRQKMGFFRNFSFHCERAWSRALRAASSAKNKRLLRHKAHAGAYETTAFKFQRACWYNGRISEEI